MEEPTASELLAQAHEEQELKEAANRRGDSKAALAHAKARRRALDAACHTAAGREAQPLRAGQLQTRAARTVTRAALNEILQPCAEDGVDEEVLPTIVVGASEAELPEASVNAVEARKAVALICAIYESARNGGSKVIPG